MNPPTVCIYCLVWEGGGEVREKVEGQKYRSKLTRWFENTNHEWMYLHSIKSVKHNAAKSVNRSILKEKPRVGVFIVHSSIASGLHQLPSHSVAGLITTNKLRYDLEFTLLFKETVLRDRFRKCVWRKLTDLGLNKGPDWFLIFSEEPLIFSWNKTSPVKPVL